MEIPLPLNAVRSFTPRIATLATGAALIAPLVAVSPLLPGSGDLSVAVPAALNNARIALIDEAERSLRAVGSLAGAEMAHSSSHAAIGSGGTQHAFDGSAASVGGMATYLDPGRTLSAAGAGAAAGGGVVHPTLDIATIDRFSQAALRVAAASSDPVQDIQAIAGVLSSLAQSVLQSLGTTPQAIQTALTALGNGDVNGAFISLESLILTPLEFFAIGPGPQTIADALTDLLPSGAAVFQTLPSITVNVGIGLIDNYIETRTAIVDAVTDSIRSLGTLNPFIIARTIGAGISAVTTQLFNAAFGPSGVIATLVNAGQQILSALVPKPAAPAADSATAEASTETKAPGDKTQHGATPISPGSDDASKDGASKAGVPAGAGTDSTKDSSSSAASDQAASSASSPASTSSASVSTEESTSAADAGKVSTDGGPSDSSSAVRSGASSDGEHTAGQPSGSTGTRSEGAASTSKPSSPVVGPQHGSSGTTDHPSPGSAPRQPGHTSGGSAGKTGSSDSAHDTPHASTSASGKGGDK